MFKEKKTIQKLFSITPSQVEMIQRIQDKKGFLSQSDTVRNAITNYYESVFPDYIYKRSAKDEERRKEADTKVKLESLDPIEFAKEYIGDLLVVPGVDGQEYIIVHGLANMLSAVRKDAIKDFYTDQPDMVTLHKNKAAAVSVASELNPYMIQYLHRNFNIDPESLSAAKENDLETQE